MKYWTGFLTAGIIGAITWALMRLAENFEELVDMVYLRRKIGISKEAL